MSSIEIIVSPQGETQLQTHGFQGEGCQAASRFLEQALGRVTQEQLTPAFYEAPITDQAAEQERT